MRFVIDGGLNGYTIEFIDNRDSVFEHTYWLQVKDRTGKELLNGVMIRKDDLKRIARGTDNPR